MQISKTPKSPASQSLERIMFLPSYKRLSGFNGPCSPGPSPPATHSATAGQFAECPISYRNLFVATNPKHRELPSFHRGRRPSRARLPFPIPSSFGARKVLPARGPIPAASRPRKALPSARPGKSQPNPSKQKTPPQPAVKKMPKGAPYWCPSTDCERHTVGFKSIGNWRSHEKRHLRDDPEHGAMREPLVGLDWELMGTSVLRLDGDWSLTMGQQSASQ